MLYERVVLKSFTKFKGKHLQLYLKKTPAQVFPANLVTFIEEILNGKLHFLFSDTF